MGLISHISWLIRFSVDFRLRLGFCQLGLIGFCRLGLGSRRGGGWWLGLGLAGVVVGFSVDFRLRLRFCRLGLIGFCRLGLGSWHGGSWWLGLGLEFTAWWWLTTWWSRAGSGFFFWVCDGWQLIHGGGRGGFWLLWVDLRWWRWRRRWVGRIWLLSLVISVNCWWEIIIKNE